MLCPLFQIGRKAPNLQIMIIRPRLATGRITANTIKIIHLPIMKNCPPTSRRGRLMPKVPNAYGHVYSVRWMLGRVSKYCTDYVHTTKVCFVLICDTISIIHLIRSEQQGPSAMIDDGRFHKKSIAFNCGSPLLQGGLLTSFAKRRNEWPVGRPQSGPPLMELMLFQEPSETA